jgi:HSF-type DNA-binding
MLNHVSYNQYQNEDLKHISWMRDGRSFKILDITNFAERTLPKFFPKIQYKSFIRQLNIYGFNRIKNRASPKYGQYFHKFFVQGQPDLCRHMIRHKIKGTGVPRSAYQRRALDNWNKVVAKPVVIESSPSSLQAEDTVERPPASHSFLPSQFELPPRAFIPPGAPLDGARRCSSAEVLPVTMSAMKETDFLTIPDELRQLDFSPPNHFGNETLEPLPF